MLEYIAAPGADRYFSYLLATNTTGANNGGRLVTSRFNAGSDTITQLAALSVPDVGYGKSCLNYSQGKLIACWQYCGDESVGPFGNIRAYERSGSTFTEVARFGPLDSTGSVVKNAAYSNMALDPNTGAMFYVYQDTDFAHPYKLKQVSFDGSAFAGGGSIDLPTEWVNLTLTFYDELPSVVIHNGYIIVCGRDSVSDGTQFRAYSYSGGGFTLLDTVFFGVGDVYRPPHRRMQSYGGLIYVGGVAASVPQPILDFDGVSFSQFSNTSNFHGGQYGIIAAGFPHAEKAYVAQTNQDNDLLELYELLNDTSYLLVDAIATGTVSNSFIYAGTYLYALASDAAVHGVYSVASDGTVAKRCAFAMSHSASFTPEYPVDGIEHPAL
jgi:hypothetical protein